MLENKIERPETNSHQPQPPVKTAPIPAAAIKQIPRNDTWENPRSHLIFFAIAYAIVLFLSVCAFDQTPVLSVFIFPIILSTVVLTAAWSVFGPGNYFQRLFSAHLVGIIPALGMLAGVFVMTLNDSSMDFADASTISLVAALSIAPLSLAAQLPFWFFRGCFGWQFVLGAGKPELPFNLKDIFAITFMFALSFAVPQLVLNATQTENDYNRGMGYVEVTQPDGSTTYEEKLVFDETAGSRRSEMRQMMRQRSLMGYAMMMAFVFVGTFVCFPFMLFVFRSSSQSTGCGYNALYALIPLIFVAGFNSVGMGMGASIFYFAFTVALCGAGLAIPFAISRKAGFVLTSPKQFARLHENQKEHNAIYKKAEMDRPNPLGPFAD